MSSEAPNNTDNRQDLPQSESEKRSVARPWRCFSRRHAIHAGLIVAAVVVFVILLAFTLYRIGYLERYIAKQKKRIFSKDGISAEIREFHAVMPSQTVYMSGVQLYVERFGGNLGEIDKIAVTIRI